MPTPIIITCELCGEDLVKNTPRRKYHRGCRKIMKAEQNRRNQRKLWSTGGTWRQNRPQGDKDIAFTTPDPWKNLMLAVVASAKNDGDQEYLDEFGQLYRDAILGGIRWQKREDGTYIRR